MTSQFSVAALLMGYASLAFSGTACPPTNLNKDWSAACFAKTGDGRRVKPNYINNLRLNQYGRTTIMIADPRELVAVDRDGKVVIPGIRHTGDHDYPNAHLGIGRFYSSSKISGGKQASCGYFETRRLRVIVPARFDHCQPFKEKHAFACTDCVSYCSEPDCQDSVLVGGVGTMLRSDGRTRKTFTLPTLDTVCARPDLLRIIKLSSGAAMLQCLTGPGDPFK